MALENNANIPTAYVYQPANIGGKMESIASRKEAKLKYELEQKKVLRAKNDAALAGVKVAKSDLTPDATLNEAILKRANQIMDVYSEAGARELPIHDTTVGVGKDLQSDINSLHEFQARMAGISNDMKGINKIKGADNDIYNYFHDKITGNPTIEGIQETIAEYNDNINLLTSIPKITEVIKNEAGVAGMDKIIDDVSKADFSKKSDAEILAFQTKINDQDIPGVIKNLNANPEIQKARGIFEFKKQKGILDTADYGGYDDFDNYLEDLVLNTANIKGVSGETYKDPNSNKISIKIDNTSTTPSVGQTAKTADVSIANSPFDFNNVTYDLAGGTTNGTIELKKKDNTKYTQADVDAMNSTVPDSLKQKYVYSLNGNGFVEVNSDVLGLSSAGEQMTITESLDPKASMSPKPYKDTSGNTQTGQIQSIRHTASGDLVGIITGGDTAELDDDVFVFLWSDKPNLKTIAQQNALNFSNQLNANVSNPDMWTFWNSNGAKFK